MCLFNFNNLLKRGTRIALRAKVNDSLITGLRVVDSLLPVGRGQRQLILGDRYTGKTSLFLSSLLHSNIVNIMYTIDGFGSKRLFGLYIGLSQSLNKLSKLISSFNLIHWFIFILSTQPSTSSLLSYMIPLIGISIAERLKDRGLDCLICFDNLSSHAKSYRQICLLQNKIPSRDAFSADVFNLHSSLLERCSALLDRSFSSFSSISCLPVIETINMDLSEYISTNVISITDGQFFLSSSLFNMSLRPSIDSSLSVTRIGSNAQSKYIKLASSGIKNELTTKRNNSSSLDMMSLAMLSSLNLIFYQEHMFVTCIETSLILLLVYRNGILFNSLIQIYRLLFLLCNECFIFFYLCFISKNNYNVFFSSFCSFIMSEFIFLLYYSSALDSSSA